MNSRRAWMVFGFANFAYVIAVLQRSSLGVAGVAATDRFHVSAALLSSLAVIQLIVYAGFQIPVGVVLDRVGPRLLLATGAALMLLGQLTLAIAPAIGIAIIGRVLLGAGDAMTFISVLRLLPNWFAGRRLPIVSQWVGTLGQVGQILSAVPLTLLLGAVHWTPTFLILSGASALSLAGILLFVRNGTSPITRSMAVVSATPVSPLRHIRDSLARPGTRLGFWSHFVTQSSGTVFSLLWGFPFLSVALGYGSANASLLLTLMVVSAIVIGPILGLLTARFPLRRSTLVLGIVLGMAIAWGIVLAWPGQPPLWSVVVLVIVIAIGGPGSLIGFDFARTFNPLRSLGSANGIVNVGGFLASFVMMFIIGLVLDWYARTAGGSSTPSSLYSLAGFRLAFLVQYIVVGTGVVFLIIARRQTRRRLHEQEGIEVAPLWVALVRAWRRRRARTR
ncbi:MAG TPA: MFS transporter [Galbitalea sp.]|nr:MFS transporter [Galbitalea sp.]